MPVDVDGAVDSAFRVDLQRMLGALGWGHASVSVVLCDDRTIQPLNRQWRGRDEPTDVLSFPQLEYEAPSEPMPGQLRDGAPVLLGDLVISTETAERQARRVGNSLAAEVRVLAAHGLCHLLGFDHDDHVHSSAMAGSELRALAACGAAAQGLVTRETGI